MADTVSISLNNIQNIKTVKIDGLGVFKVRKLGAGEQLDLSDRLRRLNQLIIQLDNMDFEQFDTGKPPTEKQRKELLKMQNKASAMMDEVNEIKKFEFATYKRCFQDNKNGKKVDELFNILSDEDRGELFRQIFEPPKPIEAPEIALSEGIS